MHAETKAPCFAKQTVIAHPPRQTIMSRGGGKTAWVALGAAAMLLVGCSSRMSPAPIVNMNQGPSSGAAPVSSVSGSYTVAPGDTLYKISKSTGVSVEELIRLNGISDPGQLRIGQVLRLSGSGLAAAPVPAQTAPVSSSTSPQSGQTSPASPSPSPAPATGTSAKPSTPTATTNVPRASDASLIQWNWPANGRIIQGFTATTKGIDIEGKEGDPVLAAADGKVMYAGNGVRGLGNLILLGHSDGFITAYAHNQSLLVKTGQEVKRGTKIATIGQTDTTSPRLHFEIRRKGTPVNPLSYLPRQP